MTFLEASYGGAEILGQVSAGVHQSQGKVQLTKRDRDTGMPVSGAVFSIYEWSNAKQDWKEHSRLSDLGQGKYQSMDLAGTADNGGRFKIAEVKAGTGYLNEKWEQEFNLADHENGLFQFEVSNQHYKGSVTVWKRDSENKEKLAGAVFTIYEWNNQKGSYESIGKLEYDVQNQCYKKDVIHYKNTNEGRFRLAETAPPPGYASNGWTAEFSLDLSSGDSSQNISYEVKNEIYKASLFVEKTDAESGKKLAGAEFTVYEWDKDSQSYHKYSTLDYDEKLQQYKKLGMRWTQKNEGKFKVMETKAPAGYQMNGFQKEFAINPSGNNVTVTFSYPAVDKRQKGIIRLQKSDKETGGKAQGQASLEGAVYLIFKKESYKAGDDENSASYAGQIVTGKEGTGESPELELGSYYVVEKKAGPGYLVDGHAYEVQLKADNQSERVFYAECPVSEQIIRGDILIYKYVQSNDPEQEVQEPLDGAEFRITSVTTGKAVTIHTDEQGMAMTKGEDGKGLLPYDTYLIEEINTPEGFKAIEPFHMKVEEDKKVYTYIIENKRILGAVQIIKKDAQTGMIIPAAGAKFKILDAQGNQIQMKVHYPEEKILDVFETDEKGQFLLPEKLTAGEYRLIEVEAPEGYMLNCEEIRFQVDGGSVYENPVIVVCTDTPAMGRIIIEKTGAADGRPIGGVTFVVRAAEDIVTKDGTVRVPQGVIVDEMITDENGRAFGNELYLGIYEVEEKDSVEGYLENSQKYKVTLSYEGQETEVMEETVYIQNEEMRPAVKVAKLADRTTGAKLVDGRYDGEKKPGTYLGSETVNYTISVTNSGNTGVRDLIVEDEISEELRPFVEEGSEGFAAVKGQVLYTKLGDRVVISQAEKNRLVIDRLEIGDSVELHYVFKLTADAEREKGLDNTVRVAGNYTDHGKDKEIPEDEDDHDNDKIDLSEPPETESEPPETESEPSETETGSPETESEPKDTESEQPETESELPETETEPPESEEPPSESEAVPTEPFTEPPAEGGESESERETEPPETKSTEPPETEKEQKIVPPVPPSHGSSPSSPVKTNDAAAGRILEMFVIMACALAAVLCIGIFRRNRNKNQDKKKKQPPMQ